MASNYTQKYRYGNVFVEVRRLSEIDHDKYRYECTVHGLGRKSAAPRKAYEVRAVSNAQASRCAIALYREEYGQVSE